MDRVDDRDLRSVRICSDWRQSGELGIGENEAGSETARAIQVVSKRPRKFLS